MIRADRYLNIELHHYPTQVVVNKLICRSSIQLTNKQGIKANKKIKKDLQDSYNEHSITIAINT